MATTNNDVLGYIQCGDCDTRGTVHQAKGRRNQLYKRCDCGCDQRNGQAVQTRLWYGTEWLPGMKPEQPPGNAKLRDDKPGQVDREDQQTRGVAADDKPVSEPDFDPTDEPIDQPEAAANPKKGLLWLAGGVATVAVAILRGAA